MKSITSSIVIAALLAGACAQARQAGQQTQFTPQATPPYNMPEQAPAQAAPQAAPYSMPQQAPAQAAPQPSYPAPAQSTYPGTAQAPAGQAPHPMQQPVRPEMLPEPHPAQALQLPGDSQQQGPLSKQAEFERILRAQVLLDRARFSPGEIDGIYGGNTGQALSGFQRARGLPVTGELDEATWRALNADPTPTLTIYTITEDDVDGPFRSIPSGMMAKSRLPELSYSSPQEALGEKFHANPSLLARLNPEKDLSRAGEQIVVPNVGDMPPLPTPARIVVKDSAQVLMLEDEYGRVIAQYPATTGSERDPLPIGTWKINSIHPYPVYNYDPKLFWDSRPGDRPASVAPGPNNPVGVVWMDLSKPHYGIHGTPVPSTVGKTDSHGCIRLTNWSAEEVAEAIKEGTEVVLVE